MNADVKAMAWAIYNKMMAYARLNPVVLDMNRVKRAIGIVNSDRLVIEDEYFYSSTSDNCGCKDMEFYNSARRKSADGGRYTGPCKHIIAHMMMEGKWPE